MMSDDSDTAPIIRQRTTTRRRASAAASAWAELEKEDGSSSLPLDSQRHEATPPRGRAKRRVTSSDSDEELLIGGGAPKKAARQRRAPPKKATPPRKSAAPRAKRAKVKEEDQEDDVAAELELKKLGFKEGQRFLCSPMGDATRAFYETLLKERPNSILANKYCIEHGVLIGTQLKEQLARYYELKEAGGFKGTAGGVRSLVKSILVSDKLVPLPVEVPKSPAPRRGVKKEK